MGPTRAWLATTLAAALLSIATAASALDLDAAKQQGLVGEQTDGYVAAVAASPGGDVEQLVADVNQKRRASYEAIAQKNGTDPKAVAALAAQKLVERAPAGAWIRDGGTWYQKR